MPDNYGFDLIEERAIPELNLHARVFRHTQTGARLLSIENNDENKVFGITFRTPPPDSTGLPHIMEHSVLCGSRKYPLREPFVELEKGSLKTFLNAFTYPDKTCYPLASQNRQDFYNLIDVYLDAVFYPLIALHTLQQEGWHYELEKVDDPLRYKGVVFNEMKGAYSSPDNLLERKSQEYLFPDNPYGLESGGNPEHIPDLTYQQFKAFHQKYYHPSNAYIYFYGDDDPQERLKILDTYLKDFEPIQVESEIPLQPIFSEPRRFSYPYDAGEAQEQQKNYISVNWLLTEVGEPQVTLGLAILSSLLLETPASPLRKALIDSGLGEDLTGRGLEEELRQMIFSTGLKGVEGGNAAKVEPLILDTLERLVRDGIPPEVVAAAVNTVEFRLRENNTGSFPQGLLLMLRSLTTWLHGGNPLTPLAFEAPLTEIKKQLADGQAYFENLIWKVFLDNPHRATVVLKPDTEAGKRREMAEQERLSQARRGMSDSDLRAVVENTLELKRRQETPDTPEALATIPTLKLSDLETEIKRIPFEILPPDSGQVLYHDLFTNGILYLDVGFNLHAIPQEYLSYVPLFAQALVEMGTRQEDYVQLALRIGRQTGGINPAWFTSMVDQGLGDTGWLFLRGKSTLPQTGDLLAILRDVLQGVRLDNRERFLQILLESKAGLEARLIPAGHRIVNRRLRARFSPADWATEQMEGVTSLFFQRQLAEQVEHDWPAVLSRLEDMRRLLLKRENTLVNVTLDQTSWGGIQSQVFDFLESLPGGKVQLYAWQQQSLPKQEGLSIPAQVNYVGKGANLYDLGYRQNGSILVITGYLSNTWLWEKVRVQGGAYGVFCIFDRHSGVLTQLSYRDPNLLPTLSSFDKTSEFLRRLELPDSELVKSIITTIGEMDAYQLPDAKGYTSLVRYLTGVNDEQRQRLRAEVLSTTQADFRAFADILEQVTDQGQVVVLGSAQAIASAGAELSGGMEVVKVL